MKTNRYKSGHVSTLIGTSQEALRFYASNEIFSPRKPTEPGSYKLYSDHDLASLYNLRSYNVLGLTLKESGDQIKEQCYTNIASTLDKMREQVERANRWNQLAQAYINRLENRLLQIEQNPFAITEDEIPSMYLFSQDKKLCWSDEAKTIQKDLASITPIVLPIYTIDAENIQNDTITAMATLGIWDEDIDYFIQYHGIQSLLDHGLLYQVTKKPCLHTMVRLYAPHTCNTAIFQHVISYLEEKKYKISGNILGNILAVNYKREAEEKPYDYYEVWIPIE